VRQTRNMDVFSMGCLLYHCITVRGALCLRRLVKT
jgi:hypothetical protein